MGELRKDYFLDEWVIISPERAKRPHDFVTHPMEPVKSTPFTPGNEAMLPPITLEYPKGEWQFRVIPNKFAIVRPEGQPTVTTDKLFTFASNYGQHEIVIEGRQDNIPFSDLGPKHISEALRIAFERVAYLEEQPHIEYVAYFKNERPEAGASISHPHSQIIATAVVPRRVRQIHESHRILRKEFGFSPLYKILDYERGGVRVIRESKHFVALCPYASRFAFEVLLIPVRDSHSYTTLNAEERDDLAQHLHLLLAKLAEIGAPYNVEWVHSKEPNGSHWYARIMPRLNVWAGFEFETGIIVNPVPPENAAGFYR